MIIYKKQQRFSFFLLCFPTSFLPDEERVEGGRRGQRALLGPRLLISRRPRGGGGGAAPRDGPLFRDRPLGEQAPAARRAARRAADVAAEGEVAGLGVGAEGAGPGGTGGRRGRARGARGGRRGFVLRRGGHKRSSSLGVGVGVGLGLGAASCFLPHGRRQHVVEPLLAALDGDDGVLPVGQADPQEADRRGAAVSPLCFLSLFRLRRSSSSSGSGSGRRR